MYLLHLLPCNNLWILTTILLFFSPVECPADCITCDVININSCTICYPGYFLNGGNCYGTSPFLNPAYN